MCRRLWKGILTDMSPETLPAAKKLPKAERRAQLLQTALAIVRAEGTDALTLGFLAERAGVSKPIAYEHFGSRSGLLIALYKQIDERQVAIALAALERAPRTLDDAARVLSDAYMNCYNSIGPEWHAIAAALRGAEEMEVIQHELMDEYAEIYFEAFLPYTKLSKHKLRVYCVGILGAAESISREMIRGRIDEKTASDVLRVFIVRCISPT
jgi:AcrR family transcriptional regulator